MSRNLHRYYDIIFVGGVNGEIFIRTQMDKIFIRREQKVYKLNFDAKVRMNSLTGECHIFLPGYIREEYMDKNVMRKNGIKFLDAMDYLKGEKVDNIVQSYLKDLAEKIHEEGDLLDYFGQDNMERKTKMRKNAVEILEFIQKQDDALLRRLRPSSPAITADNIEDKNNEKP